MAEDNKRLGWVDVAKGIGILLVVLGHSPMTDEVGLDWMSSFRIPLFFFISGMLYSDKKYTPVQYWISKIKTLLIPYFFFWITITVIECYSYPDWFYYQLTYTLKYGCCKFISISPLWFIPVLFCTAILYMYIHKIKSPYLRAAVVLSLTLLSIELSQMEIVNVYSLNVLGVALSFYWLGNILFPYIKMFFRKATNIYFLLGVGGAALIINYILAQLNLPYINMAINQLANPLLTYPAAMTGIVAIFVVSYLLSKGKYLSAIFTYMGRNSYVILALHVKYMTYIYDSLGIHSIPLQLSMMAIALLVTIEFINRCTPWILGRYKIGGV